MKKIKKIYDDNSTVGDLFSHKETAAIIKPLMDRYEQHDIMETTDEAAAANEAITEEMNAAMYQNMPLRQILSFGNGVSSHEEINEIIAKLNALD